MDTSNPGDTGEVLKNVIEHGAATDMMDGSVVDHLAVHVTEAAVRTPG